MITTKISKMEVKEGNNSILFILTGDEGSGKGTYFVALSPRKRIK